MCINESMLVCFLIPGIETDKLVSIGLLKAPTDMTGNPTHTMEQVINFPNNPFSAAQIGKNSDGVPCVWMEKSTDAPLKITMHDGTSEYDVIGKVDPFIGPRRPHIPGTHTTQCPKA